MLTVTASRSCAGDDLRSEVTCSMVLCLGAQHPSTATARRAAPRTARRAAAGRRTVPPTPTPRRSPRTASGGGESSAGGGSFGRGASSGGGRSRRTRGGSSVSYTSAEWRSIEPLARQAEEQARQHPERRDLFLCHAWEDRNGCATELFDLLKSNDATVWFSERDVGLGKSLLREIDKGLANFPDRHRAGDPGAAGEPGSRRNRRQGALRAARDRPSDPGRPRHDL